jgi:hypothetical protein
MTGLAPDAAARRVTKGSVAGLVKVSVILFVKQSHARSGKGHRGLSGSRAGSDGKQQDGGSCTLRHGRAEIAERQYFNIVQSKALKDFLRSESGSDPAV